MEGWGEKVLGEGEISGWSSGLGAPFLGIHLKRPEEARAWEPPGSTDHHSLKGREYLILLSIAFRAEHAGHVLRWPEGFTQVASVPPPML